MAHKNRRGPGRPPAPANSRRSIRREILLTPLEAAALERLLRREQLVLRDWVCRCVSEAASGSSPPRSAAAMEPDQAEENLPAAEDCD